MTTGRKPWFAGLRARVVNALIHRWQARCEHDPSLVRADILEGDGHAIHVSWCPVCGAYQRGFEMKDGSYRWGEWRSPRADFEAWLWHDGREAMLSQERAADGYSQRAGEA